MAKKQGHGGRRVNAGRPPDLTDVERLAVGARCEQLWRETIKAASRTERDRETRHVRRQLTKAHRVPIQERRAWLASDAFSDYRDDVRGALQQDQGIDLVTDDRDPVRTVRVSPKRPKGQRGEIIARVAVESGLRKSAVDRCWKEFRAVKRDVEADDANEPRANNAHVRPNRKSRAKPR